MMELRENTTCSTFFEELSATTLPEKIDFASILLLCIPARGQGQYALYSR